MNLFELLFFIIHVTVFVVVAILFGKEYGWLIGLLSGVGALGSLIVLELLLGALCKRYCDAHKSTKDSL